MVKQTATVISSDAVTGHQVIKTGKTKYTVMYDDNHMLSFIEVDGPVKLSDKEMLGLIARTTLLRVEDAPTLAAVTALPLDVWALPGRTLSALFGHMLLIDIRLEGGTTQLLELGMYTVSTLNDDYTDADWATTRLHMEILAGGAWRNIVADLPKRFLSFICDGNTLRLANGAAVGTFYRMVGVRGY